MSIELQHTPLSGRTEYILDGCVEDDLIDSGSAMALRLWGDRDIVERVVTAFDCDIAGTFATRRNSTPDLLRYADEVIDHLPLEKRGGLLAVSLSHVFKMCHDNARYMALAAMVDSVEGGMCECYWPEPKTRDKINPYKKTARRLRSPQWIRRYVKRDRDAVRLRRVGGHVIARANTVPHHLIVGGVKNFLHEITESTRRIRAEEARQWREFDDRRDAGMTASDAIDLRVKMKPGWKKRRLAERKVLRRAAMTAESVVGAAALRRFLAGDKVELIGEDIGFAVGPSGSIRRSGMHAVSLDVLTPEKDRLGSLCFYIDGTPAIDQLTAIALHVEAGAAQEIIDIANIIDVTPLGATHASLARKKMPAPYEPVEPIMPTATVIDSGPPIAPFVDIKALRDKRDADYWEETRDVWVDCLGVHVLGHRGHKLMMEKTCCGIDDLKVAQ